MTWFRLDDGLVDHAKVDALLEDDELRGLAAVGLFALAGVRCAQQLTDGSISPRALRKIAPERALELAKELVRVGLFDEDGERFDLHDFLDYNPSREEVIERREADKARKAAARAARLSAGTSAGTSGRTRPVVHADVHEDSGRPSALPDPTRPDPTTEGSSPSGRARTNDLAEQVRGILQRGIDGLTTDEPCKAPTLSAVSDALARHSVPDYVALGVAVEVRSIAQSQNRAPNIAALFAQRLAAFVQRQAEAAA